MNFSDRTNLLDDGACTSSYYQSSENVSSYASMPSQKIEVSTISVERKALDQSLYDTLYKVSSACPRPPKEELNLVDRVKKKVVQQCTLKEFGRFWVRRFPCIQWMGHYDVKNDLLADVIAGFTIAIFQVPQGMAYAMLANVPPVYGLYTSFFPVLVYALMGTSRQASIGTFAITSLMTGVLVDRYSVSGVKGNSTSVNETQPVFYNDQLLEPDEGGLTAIQVATAVALVCGILQILYGVFQLGSLTVFLSEHLISGFTCGSAVHVLSSQVKTIFGVSLKASDSGFLGLIYLYVEFFSVLHKSNVVTLGLSASTLVVLIFFKEYINLKTKKWTPVPFPIELILVVASTLISNYLYLKVDHGVKVVDHIEKGFPSPNLPPLDTLLKVVGGSVALSIVAFSSTVSLGKIFAAKYNYEIDPNQDSVALGTANIVGSLFSCIPASASISRSSVQDGAGARTQLVSLINCAGLLIVLLALGSLLEPLPNCILSCIIVVSLKGMILLSKDFLVYWKKSKVDGAIWMVTFVAVLFLDVDLGLGVGLGFALVTLIYRTVRPKHQLKGPLPDIELFANLNSYQSALDIPGVKVLYFGGPLHFANADYFSELVQKMSQLDDLRRSENLQKKKASKLKDQVSSKLHMKSSLNSMSPIILEDCISDEFSRTQPQIQTLILDCSCISYADLAAIKALKTAFKDLDKFGIRFYLAACTDRMLAMISKDEFFNERMATNIFPSLADAVARHSATQTQNEDKIVGQGQTHP